jgi:hypothetical protein
LLFTLEAEHDLFAKRISGVYIWERIRFPVLYRLLQELEITGQPQAEGDISKVKTVYRMLRSVVVRSPFFANPTDVLVWGHERRKQIDDGRWMDIYCDPVVGAVDESITYLEKLHEGEHLTPTVTEDVRYLDFVQYAGNVLRLFVDDESLLSREDVQTLRTIEGLLKGKFGTSPDLVGLVGRLLLERRAQLPLYEAILRRVDPDVALLVVSYHREPFVEACQRRGVPTVELQHGVISRDHLGYSYPGDGVKRTFPDYFFSFGEFWNEAVDLPIPADRVYSVGYPYLEQQVASRVETASTGPVLFLSQGTIGRRLSRLAVEVAEAYPELEIVYKLHPGEYSHWQSEYPWLTNAPFEVVGEAPLYDLFAESAAQVGVYSTALYEGLCFDLDTYIVDLPGVASMDRLLDSGAAQLVSTPDELGDALRDPRSERVDTDPFFRPNALENVREALADVRRRES